MFLCRGIEWLLINIDKFNYFKIQRYKLFTTWLRRECDRTWCLSSIESNNNLSRKRFKLLHTYQSCKCRRWYYWWLKCKMFMELLLLCGWALRCSRLTYWACETRWTCLRHINMLWWWKTMPYRLRNIWYRSIHN